MGWPGALPLNRGAQEGKMSGVFVHDNYYYFFIVITTFVYPRHWHMWVNRRKGWLPNYKSKPDYSPLIPPPPERECGNECNIALFACKENHPV